MVPVHQEVPGGHREEDEDDAQTSPSSANMRRPCKNTRQHNACGRRVALGQPIVMMNLMICHNWHNGKTPELREDLISLGTRLETDSPMPEPRRTRGLSTKPFVTVRTSRTRVCTGAINEDSTLKGREIFVEIVPFVFHWPIGH